VPFEAKRRDACQKRQSTPPYHPGSGKRSAGRGRFSATVKAQQLLPPLSPSAGRRRARSRSLPFPATTKRLKEARAWPEPTAHEGGPRPTRNSYFSVTAPSPGTRPEPVRAAHSRLPAGRTDTDDRVQPSSAARASSPGRELPRACGGGGARRIEHGERARVRVPSSPLTRGSQRA
jgi:hypothetical protein